MGDGWKQAALTACRTAESHTHLSLSAADKNINGVNFVHLKFCFFVVLPGRKKFGESKNGKERRQNLCGYSHCSSNEP